MATRDLTQPDLEARTLRAVLNARRAGFTHTAEALEALMCEFCASSGMCPVREGNAGDTVSRPVCEKCREIRRR